MKGRELSGLWDFEVEGVDSRAEGGRNEVGSKAEVGFWYKGQNGEGWRTSCIFQSERRLL